MSNTTQILRQIQDDAISSTVPVSEILRRCQVLAARVGIPELDEWVRLELNGYPSDVELPDYRIIPGVARGHFSGGWGSAIRNAVLPARNLPKEYRDWARQAKLRQPIAALEELAASKSNDIVVNWPGDLVALVQRDFIEHMVLGQAWLSLAKSSFVTAIETVRNRVLSFSLDAEKHLTEGKEETATASELSHVFLTTIHGNVGNLAQGSETFFQHSGVTPGELPTLLSELKKIAVPSDEIKALQSAMVKDGNSKLGSNVSQWMANMVSKAASGAWSVTLSTATTILPKLLLKYYNLAQD